MSKSLSLTSLQIEFTSFLDNNRLNMTNLRFPKSTTLVSVPDSISQPSGLDLRVGSLDRQPQQGTSNQDTCYQSSCCPHLLHVLDIEPPGAWGPACSGASAFALPGTPVQVHSLKCTLLSVAGLSSSPSAGSSFPTGCRHHSACLSPAAPGKGRQAQRRTCQSLDLPLLLKDLAPE